MVTKHRGFTIENGNLISDQYVNVHAKYSENWLIIIYDPCNMMFWHPILVGNNALFSCVGINRRNRERKRKFFNSFLSIAQHQYCSVVHVMYVLTLTTCSFKTTHVQAFVIDNILQGQLKLHSSKTEVEQLTCYIIQ